ncbi:hypothetical protein CO112_01425 [Candidatus Dojkabacteria bacterium CG_4_9_14_3_um_filter_150_Dojkabacteria_WS6_41_13]|uniref:CDP-diacylglycerol--serine O-phosphatidyltransferase n=1 Tax=Candidatus Dojkabacteria bacterium CG_4_10_14_0_2_um_filter_Dojkabacteria_WS6_41_15 TaxID=2014249 RepID=A0A2M7W2H1_9BACT|nr:MAG: hypothetical protein COZ14_04820 [Candidatus Dojkabacteria bacterium CG_4_10_14_3_um_filter_Dojkabacteria_WS6_41_9]PJA13657.1 MAG: hypothetical protein COX64_03045 [Candidatus Dojkabacteria bacterium CG_4_10_14_0_2_um_filter_Dojkabacteria_WS6_41_15]PJB23111.1 MAG: hypothetical protein CO112_01425 [Candidatus Dojkabacteria bacterium CG_4_9_14_3_um_filter_150_Dojkabacteria_WS6_41_13]
MKLTKADILSLFAIAFGWSSLLFVLENQYVLSVTFLLLAFICDLFDGVIARKFKEEASSWGAVLDSLADTLLYLLVPLLFARSVWQFPMWTFYVLSLGPIIAGFFRLARFSMVGLKKDDKGIYYEGLIVVHQALFLLFGFAIYQSLQFWGNVFLIGSMIIIPPLMLFTSIKTRKPNVNTSLAIAGIFFLYLYATILN